MLGAFNNGAWISFVHLPGVENRFVLKMVAVDVGCRCGLLARWILRIGSAGRSASTHPLPRAAQAGATRRNLWYKAGLRSTPEIASVMDTGATSCIGVRLIRSTTLKLGV